MFLFISIVAFLTAEAGPSTGTGLTVKGATYKTSSVSGGSFMMGCLPGDDVCSSNEKPRHAVTISHDMEVMTTEVTQGLYESMMGKNPSQFKGSDRPIENVSWFDVIAFSNALNRELGLDVCYTKTVEGVSWSALDCNGWRLPTEAEWEYLARGGEENIYSGSNYVDAVAWYPGNSGETHPVGQKAANGFGLYDMSGNVSELTWDLWKRDYSSDSVTDPRGPSSGERRINRGGNWYVNAESTRSSRRDISDPSSGGSHLGFRLLRKK